MPKISLRTLCLVTAALCNVQRSLEHEIPRRSFLSRRAIDGTRGKKLFDPNEDGAYDSYGSAGGYYDPYKLDTDLSDIRKNVPGEPGFDYPAYVTLPETGFTCEGRSRGYYADEATGCQVFHVCHDVLVSSFLCPIGSIFSQKLLTCDWWNKVDCSSTNRYLKVNRGSYQVDDDEMIRNAYVMIGLQSSVEDVTRDGLVDPDRIIDYSALGLFRKTVNYPAIDDTTENDLPSRHEIYSHLRNEQIANIERYQQEKPEKNSVYRDKFQFANKEQSPYHASAIIRHDNPTGNNEFQNTYHKSDGFTNSLHTSYAPTVPTVTTTTRRFYSPTVPTTYRPSTLAYNKLDLIVDSSDHLYAQSKTPATPPTISRHNDDVRNINSGESGTKHGGLKKSESVSPRTDKIDGNDDDAHSENDAVYIRFNDKRLNVTNAIHEAEVFRQQNDRPVTTNDNEKDAEDIEAMDSIGIAQTLNNPSGRIVVQKYDAVRNDDQTIVDQNSSSSRPILKFNDTSASSVKVNFNVPIPDLVLKPPVEGSSIKTATSTTEESIAINEWTEDHEEQTTMTNDDEYLTDIGQKSTDYYTDYIVQSILKPRADAVHNQTTVDQNSSPNKPIFKFSDTSASSIKVNFDAPIPDLVLKPPVEDSSVKSAISMTEKSIDTIHNEPNHFSANQTTANPNPWKTVVFPHSEEEQQINDASKIKEFFKVTHPAQFLQPPQESLFINIPEEARHTTTKLAISTTESIDIIHDEANHFSSDNNQTAVNTVHTVDANSETTWNPYTTTEIPIFHDTPSLDYFVIPIEDNPHLPLTTTTYNENNDEPILLPFNDDIPSTDIIPPINNVDYFAKYHHENVPIDYTSSHDVISPYVHPTTKQYDHTERVEAQKIQNSPVIPEKHDSKTVINNHKNLSLPHMIKQIFDRKNPSSPSFIHDIPLVITPVTKKNSTLPCYSSKFCGSSSVTPTNIAVSSTPSVEKLTQFRPPTFETWNFSFNTKLPDKLAASVPNEFSTLTTQSPITTNSNIPTEESNLKTITPRSVLGIKDSEEKIVNATNDLHDPIILTPLQQFVKQMEEIIKKRRQQFSIAMNDQQDIKTLKPEDKVTVSQLSASPERNNNFFNDATRQFEKPESKITSSISMRILPSRWKSFSPRPFSLENKYDIEESTENESSFPTTISLPRDRVPFRNANFEAFETTKTFANAAESKTPLNQNLDEQFDLATPSDHLRLRNPFKTFRTSFVEDSSVKIPLKSLSGASSSNATEQNINKSKLIENKTTGPLQKEKILEQLAENFGQPLYRSGSIHKPLVFDLPQVQRSLDFETGLPIEDSEPIEVTGENEKGSPISPTTTTTTQETTTTESTKSTIETEFVPSLGFSFDNKADREEYVQAVLGGLIDEHTREDGNEANVTPVTDKTQEVSENETSTLERQKSSEDV